MVVSTSLASQLRQLQTPQSSLLVHRLKRASFLFDEKEAANFDRDTIFEIGLSGLEELKKLNPDFASFEATLFDESSKSFERSILTGEINEQLNKQIKDICILLSPYFLLRPAHKVLEWLINRYHVHQFNVDEILLLSLPYHETMTFARLLQLIPLTEDKGKWNWLAPVKRAGVPLSKTALLNRAATDTAFYKFVCDMPVHAIKLCKDKASALSTLFSFYCSTIVGGLETTKEITDLHVSLVLPSIMAALSSRQIDFTSSAYIILARLATKTILSDELVSSIYIKVSKLKGDKLKLESALLLVVLGQSSQCTIPRSAITRLVLNTHLIPSISFWSSRDLITKPIITNLLSSSLQAIDDKEIDPSIKERLKLFVDEILSLSLDDSESTAIVNVFINEWRGSEKSWFKKALKRLQLSSPHSFDKATSEALSDRKKTATLRTLLGLTSSRSDVFDNLIHPEPQMRLQALKIITKNYKPDQIGWLCDSVLARLEDDVPSVLGAALSCKPALSCVDKCTLSSILQRTLVKCWTDSRQKCNLEKAFNKLLMNPPESVALLDLLIFPIVATNSSFASQTDLSKTESKIVNFIREKLIEAELKEKQIVWLSLDLLPKYSLVSSHLPELCQLHPVYKFLSILLLAKETTSFEPSLLTEYLESEMTVVSEINDLVDGSSLIKCLDLCKEGSLPLQPALFYMVRSSLCVKKSSSLGPTQNVIKCPDVSSQTFLPLFRVLSILLHGSTHKDKKIRNIFKKAVNEFLKKNFPSVEEQIYFLMSCALQESNPDSKLTSSAIDIVCQLIPLKRADSESRQSDKMNENDAEEMSSDHHLLSSLLSLSSPAVPMLVSLLHFKNSIVRSKVLKILMRLVESFSLMPGFRGFVEQIIPYSEEIKLDPEQIIVLCYTQLSPAKEIRSLLPADMKIHMKKALNAMISLIIQKETPVYLVAHLLEILECVNSTDFMLKLLPLLNNYIGKELVLNSVESTIVKLILKKFDDTQVDSFTNEEMWLAFDSILSDYTTSIEDDNSDDRTNPAAYLIYLLPHLLFDNLPNPRKNNQEKFLNLIITKTYECESIKVSDSVSSFFRKLSIEGEIIASLLNWFSCPPPVKNTPRKIRNSLSSIPYFEILETPEWKKGVFFLEQIQNKNKFSDLTILLPALFDILKKCLLFEQQAPVEYTKQLILSVLLQGCQSIGASPVSPEIIEVDLIVQCLRISQNPQTHHHALLALTYIANILPDNVLHSIMEIFTFIGTSIARQDDAYSFQIISKLIETIVPILVKGKNNEVTGVLRVFVGALLDIPEHRRQVLLLKLLTTLDPAEHLWIFLALVFESNVLKHNSNFKTSDNENGGKPKKLEVASQLCSEFNVQILLETSVQLLKLASILPHDKDDNDDINLPQEVTDIFNVKTNSAKQLRHFKYTLLGFLSSLLSSNAFIHQIALMSDEEILSLEDDLRRVMELCLNYVKELTKHQESILQNMSGQTLPVSRYWKVMINQAYDLLDKAVGVLPVDGFVSVVCTLLADESCCSRKVIELITWRLGQGSSLSTPQQFYPLLEPLTFIAFSDGTDALTRQSCLIAMKLLTRHLAATYSKDFIQVLEMLTNVLCSDDLPPWEVLGSLVLCLGELVSSLGAYSISQLSRFMPVLLQIIKDHSHNGELFLLSCVTCLHKIVDTLSTFLSPYMEKMIYRICYLTAHLQSIEFHEKTAPVLTKLKSIRNKLSSSVEGRILVPAVLGCYNKILKKEEYTLVSPLMSLLSDSFSSGVKFSPELTDLFLRALAFRSETSDTSCVDLVEPHVLSALTSLVLKLSESVFRPLYHKIYDWAIRGSSDPFRAITFYRLSSGLAEKLRGLFVLFAGLFVSNCATLLDRYNMSKVDKLPISEDDSTILVEFIIKTLLSVFTYDSHHFLTKERFNLLMQPLVDQLENELGGVEGRKDRTEKLLTPCLASMASATGDDSLWKQLNYQVLLMMRHSDSQVRLAALETVHQIAKKLGEDFLPLLPETVPFLAELLEDSDESIEKQTHRTISSMEAVLGEPIQKYF